MLTSALLSVSILFLIALLLIIKSVPILTSNPLTELLLSTEWKPMGGKFGFLPFIIGTFAVTALSMTIAIPPSVLSAIYISEYASPRARGLLKPSIDLLAGIPSVVFGMWGIIIVVPMFGYSLLSGAVVLAIMVAPLVISLSDEIMRTVRQEMREASIALGATKWETVKHVVLRAAYPGIIAAIVLGFGRAFGETMAVLMVVGNVASIPTSLSSPAYPIPALIANNYGEIMSIPMYDSALMFAALLLLVMVMVPSVLSETIISRMKGGSKRA
jgi:phosphate transport system permease protein